MSPGWPDNVDVSMRFLAPTNLVQLRGGKIE